MGQVALQTVDDPHPSLKLHLKISPFSGKRPNSLLISRFISSDYKKNYRYRPSYCLYLFVSKSVVSGLLIIEVD